jgi:hypothetical protein
MTFAAWMSACDSERTNKSNESFTSPFCRTPSPERV